MMAVEVQMLVELSSRRASVVKGAERRGVAFE